MELHFKSNRHSRKLYAYAELEHAVIAEWFGDDYPVDDEWEHTFFNYRGSWYDMREFERAPDAYKAHGWDAVQTESYFSAVVITYWDYDGYELDDEVIVGYVHW